MPWARVAEGAEGKGGKRGRLSQIALSRLAGVTGLRIASSSDGTSAEAAMCGWGERIVARALSLSRWTRREAKLENRQNARGKTKKISDGENRDPLDLVRR